eukprot:GHVL01038744.1.p1 GENE.GHVL01038744.1~~GHVL01038744.1.p1  ORF type:complete len:976 (+),score=165.02 GHVL01038744.1:77-3004(+)
MCEESTLLERCFLVTLKNKSKDLLTLSKSERDEIVVLDTLSNELKNENYDVLRLEHIERIIFARAQIPFPNNSVIRYFYGCFQRAAERSSYYRQKSEAVIGIIEEISNMIINYAALSLTCPEMLFLSTQPVTMLTNAAQEGCLRGDFLTSIVDRIIDDSGIEVFQNLFGTSLEIIATNLKGRNIRDLKSETVRALSALVSNKHIGELFVRLPVFGIKNGSTKAQGWEFQNKTVIGWLLNPTSLDIETCIPGTPDINQTVRKRYFNGVNSRTMSAVQASLRNLRTDLNRAFMDTDSVIQPLLRSSSDARQRVMEWFKILLVGNESRAKFGSQIAGATSVTSGIAPLICGSTGTSSVSFGMNVFWLLMKLSSPIKLSVVEKIDVRYLLREDTMYDSKGVTHTGDPDDIKELKKSYMESSSSKEIPDFKTEILFTTCKALVVLFRPFLREFEMVLRAASQSQKSGDKMALESHLGDLFCFETIILDPEFLCPLGHLFKLLYTVILLSAVSAVTTENIKNISLYIYENLPILNNNILFGIFPTNLIEASIEIPTKLIELGKFDEAIQNYFDFELIIAYFMMCLTNPKLLRGSANSARYRVVEFFVYSMHGQMSVRVENNAAVEKHLTCGLLEFYVDIQNNYYDRIMFRPGIMQLLQKILVIQKFKDALKSYSIQKKQDFDKFLYLLSGEMSSNLEDGMTYLAEIILRLKNGEKLPSAQEQVEDEDDDRQQTPSANADQRISVEQHSLKKLIKMVKIHMQLGNVSCHLLHFLSREVPSTIVMSKIALPQLTVTLNACLTRLVGPRCLELKIDNPKEYNFEPIRMLAEIAETFIHLSRTDERGLVQAIIKDGRFFSPAIFSKATRILSRETMINSELLGEFRELSQKLAEFATEKAEFDALLTDAPEEFIDPLVQEIMEDPVQLPSGYIMDRKTISTHLANQDHDPFTRQNLSIDQIQSLPELKDRIEKWKQDIMTKRSEI